MGRLFRGFHTQSASTAVSGEWVRWSSVWRTAEAGVTPHLGIRIFLQEFTFSLDFLQCLYGAVCNRMH